MALVRLEVQLRENQEQVLDNSRPIFPDVFLFIMQYFRNKMNPSEAHGLALELRGMIEMYHGKLEDLVSAYPFDIKSFKEMDVARKQLVLKIKNRLDMIDELQREY